MRRTEYTLCSSKVKSDKNIAIVSDLHISENMPEKRLTEVLDTLDDIDPTHIVIPGDLYNVDMSTIGEEKVTNFMNSASEIADVFYVKGNTEDMGSILNYRILPNGLEKNDNSRIHILCENQKGYQTKVAKHNDLSIAGIRLPEEFYRLSESEKVTMLLNRYDKYLDRLLKQCGEKSYNILLCHDPIIRDMILLMEAIRESKISTFDLVISGHNHGGIYPNSLRPLFKMAGKGSLYPSYTDGIHCTGDEQYGIVSEGITKYPAGMGIMSNFERFHEGTIENVRVLKK